MIEIFKSSMSELYKKPFRITVIFLLNLFVAFGINRFDILAETFTIFVPAVLGIIFINKEMLKKWKNILINLLIYIGIFSINTYFLYKHINILYSGEFISDGKIILFNLISVTCDIVVSVFAVGFLYSFIKDLKYKIAVIDMLKYFSEKSSKILVLFYGMIFSLFVFILVLYGLNSDICYNPINIFFLLFTVIFICFLMLVLKNFLISNKKDEVICRLKEKSLGFYIKSILIIILPLITICFLIIFATNIYYFSSETAKIFLSVVAGLLILLLIVILEVLILNILIKINGRVNLKPMSLKKFFSILTANIIGIFFMGILTFVNYIIDMNFFIYSYLQYFIFFIVFSCIGLALNFQIVGILIDKPFSTAFKDGFALASKFLNLKILTVLAGEVIFFMFNIINGTFMAVIYFLNIVMSFYLLEFYLKEITEKELKEIDEVDKSIEY